MIDFQGKNVVVLGLAKSGVAVAKLLHKLGAKVVVNDRKPREKCPEAAELEQLQIPVICGGHPESLIHQGVDVVVKNPGIPYHIPPIQNAFALNIPVITEVEIAGLLSPARIIGITGSNGKTTTTTLVGKMLAQSGVKATVAGNIGQALTDVVQDLSQDEWMVAELSSFQLKGTIHFRPKIGALLNIGEAHLDYHQTFEDYAQSKLKLFANQTAEDYAVINRSAHQTLLKKILDQGKIKAQVVEFSITGEVSCGVFVKNHMIMARMPGREEQTILPVSDVALPGSFNLENALAAAAISLLAGANAEGIQEVLRTFRGVEHRLEYVTTKDGVQYYNDSKATNAQAAMKALLSFDQPIVWIAGGLDRGVDFKELVPVIRERVKAVIAYGQTADILKARAKDADKPSFQAKEIEEAVKIAKQVAEPGDIVLLSPACASWDLYTSFEERGIIFKQAVHRL
jgi:UDP-N-acetylmuramoylalanine--D-glutamate ligase